MDIDGKIARVKELIAKREELDAEISELLGGGGMIDFGKDREAGRLFLFHRGFESRDGLFHRILASLGDQAVVGRIRGGSSRAYRDRERKAC